MQEFSSWGDSGPSDIKKSSDNVFLVLNIFYRGPKVTFKENYPFPRFQRWSYIFGGGGGPISSRGGLLCPFAYSL